MMNRNWGNLQATVLKVIPPIELNHIADTKILEPNLEPQGYIECRPFATFTIEDPYNAPFIKCIIVIMGYHDDIYRR